MNSRLASCSSALQSQEQGSPETGEHAPTGAVRLMLNGCCFSARKNPPTPQPASDAAVQQCKSSIRYRNRCVTCSHVCSIACCMGPDQRHRQSRSTQRSLAQDKQQRGQQNLQESRLRVRRNCIPPLPPRWWESGHRQVLQASKPERVLGRQRA